MRRIFPSLLNAEKYGYVFDTEAWDSRAQVLDDFRCFETYGDGTCQHSRDWSITRDFMTDYLASLAAFIMTFDPRNEEEGKFVDVVRWHFGAPDFRKIAAAAKIIWKDAKTRYYNKHDFSVTSSSAKEHDRRFERIEKWMDGSPKATYRLLAPEFPNAMECFALADGIRQWLINQADGYTYMALTADFLEWFEGDPEHAEKARAMHDAFYACQSICESFRLRATTESAIDNLKRRLIKPKAEPVEAA